MASQGLPSPFWPRPFPRLPPPQVAVCPLWLQGACPGSSGGGNSSASLPQQPQQPFPGGSLSLPQPQQQPCRLQHRIVQDLMPACAFFLDGACGKPDCPYLHVNYGPDVPACRAFLAGYCPRGAQCPLRHVTAQRLRAERSLKCGRLSGGGGRGRLGGARAGVSSGRGGGAAAAGTAAAAAEGGKGVKRGRAAGSGHLKTQKRVRAMALGC